MKKQQSYLRLWRWFIPICLVLCCSCRATRHLEEGQVLLKKDPILKHDKKLRESVLMGGVRIRDNRRMLWPKTFLHIHNFGLSIENRIFSNRQPIEKEDIPTGSSAKFLYWLKHKVGEAPILIDTFKIKQDMRGLRESCFANGYFYPQISYKIDTLRGLFRPKQKAKLTYMVNEGIPYKIRDVGFVVLDSADTTNTQLIEETYMVLNRIKEPILVPGNVYRHADFSRTRAAFTNILRDQAFVTFTQDMIRFAVDTSLDVNFPMAEEGPVREKWLDIDVEVTKVPKRFIVKEIIMEIKDSDGHIPKKSYLRLRADELSKRMRDSLDLPFKRLDSTTNITFLVSPLALNRLNFNFLAERVHQAEGKHYYEREVRRTRQRLQELGMFQYVLVDHQPIGKESLELKISLQLAPRYQMKAGAESFTSDVALNASIVPNLGANLSLRNKNAFKHSELFQLDLGGSVGWNSIKLGRPDYYSLVAESKIQFHKFLFLKPFSFLLPKSIRGPGIAKLSPTTVLSGSFRSENWGQITQLTPGLSLTYRWKNIPFEDTELTSLTPFSLKYINPVVSNENGFATLTEALPDILKRDFQRRINSAFHFSYTNQNYRSTRAHITHFYKATLEVGGTLPYFIEQAALWQGLDEDPDDHLIRGIFYGQYARLGLEGKWYIPTGRKTELVFRGLIGGGTPIRKTELMPKEGRFFVGGVNGMRGWQSNTLGPGRVGTLGDLGVTNESLIDSTVTSILAPGGEYLFELNAEFRFDAGTYLELALFTDAGNVWVNPGEKSGWSAEKATLSKENLRLGWDAGIGIRFDFSFLILRLDFGQQLFAPDLVSGWVIGNDEVRTPGSRRQWNLGIDYPF
ncbi:MAG: BamA/TamA family outer membrane protein [Bacteroidota bacterium]